MWSLGQVRYQHVPVQMALTIIYRILVWTLNIAVAILRLPFAVIVGPLKILSGISLFYDVLFKQNCPPDENKMKLNGKVIIYSNFGCPDSMRAKNTLQGLGIPFHEVRLDLYPKVVRQHLLQKNCTSCLPQIFFNEFFIGGFKELEILVSRPIACSL